VTPRVLTLVVVAVLVFAGCDSDAAPSTTDTGADEVLIIAGTIFGIGGYHRAVDGVWTGFETDLLDEITARIGLIPKYVAATFDNEVIDGLARGQYDIGSGRFSVTPEREQVVAFTSPHLVDKVILYTTEDSGVGSIHDLAGGVVAVTEGTSGEWFMRTTDYPGIELVDTDPISASESLASGSFDGWVTGDNDSGFNRIEIGTLRTAFPADPAQPRLVEAINAALAEMIADGTYDKIYQEWFDSPDGRVDL
jgi:ABC-type amino acid transport substrate-binding protein